MSEAATANDLFISYAHIDNLPITEDERGWITEFHRILENRLAQLMGEQPRVWRDQKLTGNDIFDQKIVSQFDQTKLMVSILSPRYIKSEWCVKEITEFYQSAEENGGVAFAGKSRILKVVKTPYDPDDLQPELRKIFGSVLGFNFYDFDENGKIVEYNEAFGKEAKQNYFSRIYDLAYEICEILKKSRGGDDTRLAKPAPELGAKTVYLATVTADRMADRENIARDLRERGHVILPDNHLPLNASEVEQTVGDYLKQADVAIHLLGSNYGLIPEAGSESVIETQVNLAAAESANRNLERLIWLPSGLETREDRQSDFIESLRVNPATYEKTDFVEGTFEVFKGLVIDHFTEERSKVDVVANSQADAGPPTVYLMAPPDDEDKIEAIEDYLFDQGLEVVIPLFSGSEAEVSEAHMENLRICDGVLIYFGSATRQWVNMKLNNLIKASGQGRSTPITATAILVAPPESRHKDRFRSHLAEIVQVPDDDFSPLGQFIAKIKK